MGFCDSYADPGFVTQEDACEFIPEAVAHATRAVTGVRPDAMPRMSWTEAQERFGTDKPDTRFGMELHDLTDIFAETESNVFKTPAVKGIRMPGGADSLARNAIDELTEKAKRWGAKGLAWFRVREDGLEGSLTKFMSETELAEVPSRLGAESGDMVFLIADRRRVANRILGLLRLELGLPPGNEGGFHFLWITALPLFEDVIDGNPIPAHHPFTMPHDDDVGLLDTAEGEGWLDVRSQAYDLVLNGWELGSGSIRIHRADIQSRIFDILGIGPEEQQRKFGFLLDAFRYGAPPHGGFAFGIDRLTALLVGEENIREVIAFPKTQSGSDPLTNAPGPVDSAHLEELGLRVLPQSD